MSIELHNIHAGYGRSVVLKGISTQFLDGKFHTLIGPNGSGKSTLLKVMAQLIRPLSGTLSGLSEDKPISQQIAYLSQIRTAHPQMLVSDIIALGRVPFQKPFKGLDPADKSAINTAIDRADINDLKDNRFGTLSGGQQARVLLARALAVNAPILLVDEPVAALDPYYQLSILEVLKTQAEHGKTVIAALHDLSLVRQFADTVTVMKNGHIYSQGAIEDTLTADTLKTVFRIQEQNGLNIPL